MSRSESKVRAPNADATVRAPGVIGAAKAWRNAAVVFLLAVVVYLPALRCGFIWDDDDYVTENLTLRDWNGLKRIWLEIGAVPQYYPLVHTTFWLEYRLWGLNPAGFHAVNVALHGLAAVLLGLCLQRLALRGAWLAAAVFAVHPVMVESVAWITERKNVLSAVFYFAAALAYLRWRERAGLIGSERGAGLKLSRHYAWALGLFVCAMLSKTVTCSLPAALLLVAWWREGRVRRREVLALTPFFAVGIALGLLTVWIEKHNVGARGPDWELSFFERVLIAGRALWFYVSKLAWPSNLTFIYPRWEVSTAVWWQWLFPAGALAVVGVLWALRGRIGRGPLTAVLFFAGTLFPALGFFNVYPMRFSFVADHFQYLASVGLIALAAEGACKVTATIKARGVVGQWPGRWVAVPVVVLGALTWRQCGVYRDLETLWRDTLAKNPGCWMAHNNLGHLLATRGQIAEAEAHYRKALEQKPDYEEALNNLGHALLLRGKVEEAMEYFGRALAREPNHPQALNNLGVALLGQGREEEALDCFRRSLAVAPHNPETLNNYGAALAARKQFAEALACYEKSLRLRPGQAQAHLNVGVTLRQMGRVPEAVAHLSEAVRLAPELVRARSELAAALAAVGRLSEALEQAREAVRLAPGDASALYNLGVLLSACGQTGLAIEQYRAALKAKPDYAEAHNNLGVALALQGRWEEAASHLREALRLEGHYAEAHNNLAFVLLEQ
ncbi:MAG: tetratricopeptide repeat protein, partial [Verrucomicrobiales bacterium]|nr:tetratricopeptide repeat protein [Verrucomicrobiales bacterium]